MRNPKLISRWAILNYRGYQFTHLLMGVDKKYSIAPPTNNKRSGLNPSLKACIPSNTSLTRPLFQSVSKNAALGARIDHINPNCPLAACPCRGGFSREWHSPASSYRALGSNRFPGENNLLNIVSKFKHEDFANQNDSMQL